MRALLHLSVTGPAGLKRSRIGAVARAADGSVIALGARHLLDAEAPETIHDAGTQTVVGRRLAWSQTAGYRRPAHEAVGGVRVEARFDWSGMIAPYLIVPGVVDAEAALGKPVFKYAGSANLIEGVVTGLGSALLRDPVTGGTAVFAGLIQVCLAKSDAFVVGRGEAGALFLDAERRAVGLLIGGVSERCFLVPLAEVLQARGLTPYLGQAPEVSFHRKTAMELELVRVATRQLWDDLRGEPKILPDPAGDDVPQELSDLLAIPA